MNRDFGVNPVNLTKPVGDVRGLLAGFRLPVRGSRTITRRRKRGGQVVDTPAAVTLRRSVGHEPLVAPRAGSPAGIAVIATSTAAGRP